ncbi:MAG TPA: hypothetical protein VF587_17975 [Solirubrobacteraceae bacterium]|jgi:hypothetical protein
MRRLAPVLLALLALLAPATATAAVTTTEVTSPDAGDFFLVGDPAKDVTVSGVAPGATNSDVVDLLCRRGNESDYIMWQDVPVNGEAFSVTFEDHVLPAARCRVLAVADGTDAISGDFSDYDGPLITVDWRRRFSTDPGDASSDVPFDWYEAHSQRDAFGDFLGVSSCGVCDTALYYDDGTMSNYVHYSNGYLDVDEEAVDRPAARVDGHNAYGSRVSEIDVDGGSKDGADLEGVPPIDYVRNGGGPGEELEMLEEEDLVRCADGDPYPVTSSECDHWISTGVRFVRRMAQTRGGKLILISDTFRSVDGAEHALDLLWGQAFRKPNGAVGSYQFPWNGDGYATHDDPDTVPGTASAPVSIYVRTKSSAPDGDRAFPQGLVMFDHAVGDIRFADPDYFLVPTALTVPAGGEVTMRQAYALATTRAELAGYAGEVEDQWIAPAIEITSPAEDVTVNAPELDVAGRASDTRSTPTVTLNGEAVALGADGTWARRVTLQPGPNTLTAVARDAQGNETTATRTVTFTPPSPPPPPLDTVAPALTGVSLTNRVFAVARGRTPVAAAAKRGTRVRYSLSEPATVTFAFSRARAGRRVGGRCRKATRSNRRRKRCTRFVRAGRTIRRTSPVGRSTLRFTGRIGRRALRRGRYRMAVRAADAAGNRSSARRVRFRIVRR